MDIYMVGVYKRGNKIVGFKMLDPNQTDISKQTMDVSYDAVLNVIRSKTANIVNLKLEDGKLKGYNGSIDRYGVFGKTQALVIIKKVLDTEDNLLGYICSNCSGNMRLLPEKQVIDIARQVGLANGRVVTDNSGKSYISAIEGTYPIYRRQQQSQPQQQLNKNSNIDEETIGIINKLQLHKNYKGSFAEKIVLTIKKLNRCTPKQKACLQKILKELEAEDNTQQPIKQQEKQKVEQVQQPSQSQKIQQIQDINDTFIVELMNNQLYIKKLKEPNTVKNIVIPDKMEYNGKTYMISGISANAFNGSNIERIVTGRNITDIGQGAFADCMHLKEVDLSLSRHQHIAMNCFKECVQLKAVKVGNYVQRIHEAAFLLCQRLEEIDLPESVNTIARTAFMHCHHLKTVRSSVTTINDSAFSDCYELNSFDFSKVISIGSHAFRYTAFKKLVLPGNINSIGSKAFSDVYELREVELQDGIESLGDYCFAKSKRYADIAGREHVALESIMTCKSIKEIGADVFRNAKIVKVWTGSVAESHCIGFGVPYIRLDGSTTDNATRVRIKSEIIDANPMATLLTMLESPTEGASNPSIEMNTSKLVDIEFNQTNFDFFHIPATTEVVEPHAKFIGLINYLQDVGDLFKDPLSGGVLRLQTTYNVTSHEIYNDGCNRVYKVIYSLVDTLEEGGFIMVIMNNHLRYVTELNIATDVNMTNHSATDENIPIKKFIHAGDKIGNTSTISGYNGILEKDGEKINVGKMFFERINNHCIEVTPQRKDSIWYIPATGLALKLHDKREWEKSNYSASGKKIARGSQDCLNVLEIMTYQDFVNTSSTYRKHTIDSNKFFKTLKTMTEREVNSRIKLLANVEEEKEAQLFQVSKRFINMLQTANRSLDSATPNDLAIGLFKELARSYWMIEKDQDWLDSTGKKSLNKTNEYTIDGYKLVEYKSNQVVKFSNPYMNGQKGAYVFTLVNSGRIQGVYASRHSMQHIIEKLIKLTQMKPSTVPINLMQDAYNIDMCEHDLFYNFYDVLYSKDGWKFNNYINGYNRAVWGLSADFHIAMYKPTGIFYLTMESYVTTSEGANSRRTMPVLPIGNMDRALMIATTTNSKNKDSKLLEELMVLAAAVILRSKGVMSTPSFKFKDNIDINAYFKARELAIQGVKDIEQYKKLVNDRVVYMLGTVHKGVLQREYSDSDEDIDIDISDEELDISDEELDISDIDIDIDDTDETDDLDIEDIYDEDEDIYDEDDEDGSSVISDEDALELQKQLEAAGHKLSLEQIKLMAMQQMKD